MNKQFQDYNFLINNKFLNSDYDIDNDKFNEDNFYNDIFFQVELPENITTGLTPIKPPKPLMDGNKIVDGDKTKNSEKNITSRGRKRKNSKEKGIHNKYSQDNILRRIKCHLLLNLLKYINEKIAKIYKRKIGRGIFEKQLKKLCQKNIMSSKAAKNLEFLSKTLKEIFSGNISSRYSYYDNEHNKRLIDNLLNESNMEIREYFRKLFSLTFLDCLSHFRGDKYFEELEGLEKLESIIKQLDDDQEYMDLFKYYALNYEKVIMRKKPRNKKKIEIIF